MSPRSVEIQFQEQRFPVTLNKPLILGRNRELNLFKESCYANVPRRHVQVLFSSSTGQVTIERISPKGDSTLNGQPLACDTPITVKDGDCLNLAHNTDIMTFRIAEPIESSSISESNPKTEPKKLYRQDFSDESDFLDDIQWIKKGPNTAGLPPSASPQPVFTKETVKRQKKAVVKKEPVVKRTAAPRRSEKQEEAGESGTRDSKPSENSMKQKSTRASARTKIKPDPGMVEEPKLSTRLLGKRKAAILNESSHDEESDVDKVMIKKELESSQTTFIADSDDGAYNSDASTVPPSDNGDDKRETRTVKDEPMSSQDTAIQFTPTASVSIKPKKTILAMSSDEEDC